MAANAKRHYDRDPSKVINRVEKYKAQKDAAGGYWTDYDIQKIRRELEDKCYYCGVELAGGGEIDHKLPVSRGGTNWPDNLTLACTKCNRDKHCKTPDEFFEYKRQRGQKIRNID